MIKYIKDSIRELKHVVWPTREETTNYFITVVLVLTLFGIYLFIASTFFTKSLFGLKDIFDSNKIQNNVVVPKTKVEPNNTKIPKMDSVKVNAKKVEISTGATKNN